MLYEITDEDRRAAADCRDIYGNDRKFHKWRNDEWYYEIVNGIQEVTIRGSDDPLDWIKNLNTSPFEIVPGTWGAAGFDTRQLQYGFRICKTEIDQDMPVRFRGHSRGGMLAINLATELSFKGYDVRDVITFGCPRGQHQRTTELDGVEVRQFAIHGDLVPWVPFYPPWKWRNQKKIVIGKRSKTWELIKRHKWRVVSLIADGHSMANYCSFMGVS